LAGTFGRILKDANYQKLSKMNIEEALDQSSLIPVNTIVDLNEYKKVLFFYRGSTLKKVTVKKYFREKSIVFDNYEYVEVLPHIKEKQ